MSLVVLAAAFVWAGSAALAQQGPPPPPPQAAPAPQASPDKTQDYRLKVNVNLVVLHASVLDDRGKFVPDLKQENFRIFEDKVEQKLALFKREDVPISVGLVIDNSGSMRAKRDKVNAAALTFVKTSNPRDEAFIVNFNDDFYLDLDKDFTSDIAEMREALERIDSRGSTALYDAVIGSLDHLKKGSRDKKVLLVITDGDDNASRKSLDYTIQAAQKSDALIYAVGIFSDDEMKHDHKLLKKARRALTAMADATGGMAFFPEDLQDVESICTQIANDIRNQYILAYYPSNQARDGSFRSVQVQVLPPRGRGKLSVRTRNGYYARSTATATGN